MKKLLLTGLVSVSLLSLVACGKSDLTTIEKIQENGKLTMMTASGFPPYEYLGDDGYVTGIDIDLAALVAEKLGVEYEVLDMDFGLLVESVKSGKGDIVAAAMTVTPERSEQVAFTTTYATAGQVVLVPADSTITSINEITNYTVAVQESTTGHIYVEEELGITPLAYKTGVICADALVGGKADCVVIDDTAARLLVQSYGADKLKVLDPAVTSEDYAMAVKKGDDEFLTLVNQVINDAIADGTVASLMEKHTAATS